MNLQFCVPTPLEYFASLVDSDAQFPLLEAAICLAHDSDPGLDVQQVLGDVDQLLARLKRRLPPDATLMHRLHMLNQFFFSELNFAGNVNDYYDPDNSFLSAVLRTRRGIPITLAVLWIELAQGVGLAARGVSFPGHFLVKVNLSKGQVVIDPYNGQSLGREDLLERLEPMRQRTAMPNDDFDVPLGLYLQAAKPREIIGRMLRNLKDIYKSRGDVRRMTTVCDRLIVLWPQGWTEYRDRGLLHAELGHLGQALSDLQTYVMRCGDGLDLDVIAGRLAALRQESKSRDSGAGY